MKKIHAVWEQRNLHLDTWEVEITKDDSREAIRAELQTLERQAEYLVIKVPVGRADVFPLLSELSYTFAEAMTHSEHDMACHTELSPEKSLILEQTEFSPMTDSELEHMYAQIQTGLYTTDRISLDPYFSPEIANRRYVGWLRDEMERGSELYGLRLNGEVFGFIGFKKRAATCYQDVLNGIYPQFQGRGLAVSMTYKLVNELSARGCEKILIDISSNNPASLQSRLRHGYKLKDLTYVFFKHCLPFEQYRGRLQAAN